MSLGTLHLGPLTEGQTLYRFEGQLTDRHPIGLLPEGLRFAVPFDGTVTEGPFVGARMWGIDHFLVRPDGVGVIDAPETLSFGDRHVFGHARGYVLPPDGVPMPSLQAMLAPGFEWPEIPFRLTGSVMYRASGEDLDWMNRVVATIAGEVTLATGRLVVEARVAP
jgi:hypothetical protein